MIDFFGDEINVGDWVIRSYKDSTDLLLARVTTVEENKVHLETYSGRKDSGLTKSIKLMLVPKDKMLIYKLER